MKQLTRTYSIQKEWGYSLCLLLMLFLPHNGILYIINPIIVCLLSFTKRKSQVVRHPFLFPFVLIILLSFVINVLFGGEISIKPIVRALGLILCFLLFPFAENVHLPKWVFYFSILFILFSQLCSVLGLSSISDFFSNLYISEETQDYIERYMESGASLSVFRLGGLFNNPNQCAKYVTVIYTLYEVERLSSKEKTRPLFIALCTLSVILTGSRTGLFVLLIVMYFSLIDGDKKVSFRSIFLGLLATIIFVSLAVLFDLSDTFRAFSIKEGINDSLSAKFGFLSIYLNSGLSLWQLLFGNFFYTPENVQIYLNEVTTMDSELGVCVFTYGFSFVIVYIYFLLKAIKTFNSPFSRCLLLFFWCLSSTILFSYRASFLILFVLSKFYPSEK